MKRTPRILLAIVMLWMGTAEFATAQPVGPTLSVQIGFDGYCRRGEDGGWCAVYAVMSNEGAGVEGELRVSRDVTGDPASGVYARPVALPAHSRKAYSLLVPSAEFSARSHMEVQLVAGGEVLAAQQAAVTWLREGDRLYGIASDSPSTLNFLNDVAPAGGRGVVAHLDLVALPSDPLGWEGLDVLVLSDVDTTGLSTEQRGALGTWVAHGGHLVVGGGPGVGRTAAGVAGLLPVVIGATRSVDDLWAVGEWVGAPVAPGPYAVVQAVLRDGEVLLRQADELGDLILLARRTCGAGTVDFLAFDAGLNPFTRWDDNRLLWERVVGMQAPHVRPLALRNGYSASDAVRAIPGMALPSVLHMLAFMLVYTILVGPVNYLVLRKLDRRELAWLTVPALVVGFTVYAYVTGFRMRGGQAIVHRLAAVYVPQGADVGRVSQVVGFFSPRRATYDVQVAVQGVSAVPGDDRSGPGGQPLHVLEQGLSSTVTGLRVDVGGIQTFVVEGYADVSPAEADLHLALDGAGNLQVEGTLRNGSVSLQDAVLIVGDNEQQLGDLEAGEEVNIHLPYRAGYGQPGPAEQILGPGNYWEDRESYRRYQFLQALSSRDGLMLEQGVYLVGWASQAPLSVEVVERPFSTLDMAFHVYRLPVTGVEAGTTVTIPSGLITRQVEATAGGADVWPEGLHLEPGAELVFRYTVWREVMVGRVDSLVLDMQGHGAGPGRYPPAVWLWNYEQGEWERLDVGWGQHSIPNGAAYVTPSGHLLLRLQTGAEWPADVESLAVTIKGQR